MTHLLEADKVSKYFGNVIAVKDISAYLDAGEVLCILGDNGAGKSTLIKILSGVHQPAAGIATVYQDLAIVPLMSVWRNFFLGAEPTKGAPPLRYLDVRSAKQEARRHLLEMGIDIRDPDQPVGTLSGGERQAVAISRAVYFGARVLILDEPTSALGVKASGIVLRNVVRAREHGAGVVFITHNPHHAYPVGDRFVILNRGQTLGTYAKGEIDQQELVRLMAGGAELAELQHELESLTGS